MHKVLNETVRDLEKFHPSSLGPLRDALDFILLGFIMCAVNTWTRHYKRFRRHISIQSEI